MRSIIAVYTALLLSAGPLRLRSWKVAAVSEECLAVVFKAASAARLAAPEASAEQSPMCARGLAARCAGPDRLRAAKVSIAVLLQMEVAMLCSPSPGLPPP